MNPQHIENISDPNRIAHAPYNFVELPEDIVKAEPLPEYNCYHQNTEHQIDGNTIKINRHTGRIECTLTTKSIFYTRCGLSPENFAKYSEPPKFITKEEKEKWEKEEKLRWEKERKEIFASFFSYTLDNLPVIPGSSLRGMLRTLVEIVSFSKIDRVTDKKLFYRSIADRTNYTNNFVEEFKLPHLDKPDEIISCYRPKVHAGFLRKRGNSYIIEECGYGRINFDLENPKNSVIKNIGHHKLYEGDRQGKTPKWQYQHQTIYVEIDKFEKDNFFPKQLKIDKQTGQPKINHRTGKPELRHSDMYLRFREVHFASFTEAPNLKKAKLVISGDMQFKHLEFVFLEDKILNEYSVSKENIIERFQDDYQVTKWQADAFPKDKPCPNSREQNGYLRDGEPVFFLLNDDGNTIRFLGRAQMFRLPYESSPLDFVPPQLRDASSTDIAEAIFGYVNGKEPREKTCASRVFITDGILKKEYQDKVKSSLNKEPQQILLSSPKPTTFQHYLVQPKETQAKQHNLKHYASKPPTKNEAGENVVGETIIRGHKLYWHKPSKIEVLENADTQTSLIKPIDSNIEFTFNIYFENLSDVELGSLLWVIDKAEQPEYCLSLGMGKPLGMGAVKIESQLYLSDRTSRYSKLFDSNKWAIEEKTAISQDYTDFVKAFEEYILDNISIEDYPQGKDRGEILSISHLPRIEMLLAMLTWNKPLNIDRETRYMEIKRDIGNPAKPQDSTVNEYKERPVLPTPLQVMGWDDNRRINNTPSSPSNSANVTNTPKPKLKGSDVGKPIKKDKHNQQQQKPKDDFEEGNFNVFARPQKPKL